MAKVSVMGSTGVIGKITNVSTFSSDVRLITTSDTNNKISVSVSNGSDNLYGLINYFQFSYYFKIINLNIFQFLI